MEIAFSYLPRRNFSYSIRFINLLTKDLSYEKGKPIITLHPPEHDHALKEVDAAALAMAREPEQVVEILRYVLSGTLPA